MLRSMRRYHANTTSVDDKVCVKHKPSTRKLGPGLMVRSVMGCCVTIAMCIACVIIVCNSCCRNSFGQSARACIHS